MASLLFINQVKNIGASSDDFIRAVANVAAAVGAKADDLMTVMYFESGLNPAAKNPYGSATGLIQFTEDTAQRLGTSTAALRSMTAMQQLYYVEKYLKPYAGRIGTLGNLYLAVFYPAYIGRPSSTVIPLSSAWVNANRVLDINADGKITVGEVMQRIYDWQKQQANKLGYLIGGGAIALLLIVAGYIILR